MTNEDAAAERKREAERRMNVLVQRVRERAEAESELQRCERSMQRAVGESESIACQAKLEQAKLRLSQAQQQESAAEEFLKLNEALNHESSKYTKLHLEEYETMVRCGVPDPRWDELVRLCYMHPQHAEQLARKVRDKSRKSLGRDIHEYFIIERAIDIITKQRLREGDVQIIMDRRIQWAKLGLWVCLGALLNTMMAFAMLSVLPDSYIQIYRASHDLWVFATLPGALFSVMLMLLHPTLLPWKWFHRKHELRFISWLVMLGVMLSGCLISYYYY